MKHLPWDMNTINDAMDQVLGVHPRQETCKTLCGRRVPETQIDRKRASRLAFVLVWPIDAQDLSEETGRIECPECFRTFQDQLHAAIDASAYSRMLPPLPPDNEVFGMLEPAILTSIGGV